MQIQRWEIGHRQKLPRRMSVADQSLRGVKLLFRQSVMTAAALQMDAAGLTRNSAAASVSGRSPVRVQVHRKLYKDLAGLSRVQTLQAHTGNASHPFTHEVFTRREGTLLGSLERASQCKQP